MFYKHISSVCFVEENKIKKKNKERKIFSLANLFQGDDKSDDPFGDDDDADRLAAIAKSFEEKYVSMLKFICKA